MIPAYNVSASMQILSGPPAPNRFQVKDENSGLGYGVRSGSTSRDRRMIENFPPKVDIAHFPSLESTRSNSCATTSGPCWKYGLASAISTAVLLASEDSAMP